MKRLADIRDERTLASQAQQIADRYARIEALRRAVSFTYVADRRAA